MSDFNNKLVIDLFEERDALKADVVRLTLKVAELYEGAEEQKQRIKRLEEVATDQRNRAEKWYIEEREDGDSVSIATTRAYFLAYTEIVREIRKAKEAKL